MWADKDKSKEMIRKQKQWPRHKVWPREQWGRKRHVMGSAVCPSARSGKLLLERARL